jgi:hypothetical protein
MTWPVSATIRSESPIIGMSQRSSLNTAQAYPVGPGRRQGNTLANSETNQNCKSLQVALRSNVLNQRM